MNIGGANGPDVGALGADALFLELARILDAVGSSEFYDLLSRLLARANGSDYRLVIRYHAYDRPSFLLNNFMSPEAISLYLAGLYTIDPLQERVRSKRVPEIVHLRSSQHNLALDDRYLHELFKIAFIFDELAVLLPALGGVTIAICCDRRHNRFTDQEVLSAAALVPLIASIHRRHLSQSLVNAVRRPIDPNQDRETEGPLLILGGDGSRVYASSAWGRQVVGYPSIEDDIRQAHSEGSTSLPTHDGNVVHWEALEPSFPVAPGGLFVTIEKGSFPPPLRPGEGAVDAFCARHGLTPREADVVRLILAGYPNSRIAEQLHVSPGTVKNHRWRLYYKLDITTERELFVRFLSGLLPEHDSLGSRLGSIAQSA